jgi:HK97 family phage major capsid protein
MIQVSHRSMEELQKTIEELEILTSKPSLSSRDEKRHSFLLAKMAMLRQGVSVSELRNFEIDKLRQEAGLDRLPERASGKMDPEVESEWRAFANGGHVRPTSIPKDVEVRANEAGTQSITTTQGAAGGFFVPQDFFERTFSTMKQYDNLFDDNFCTVVQTETGGTMPFPVIDDVSNASVQVGEAAQSTEVDVANFGQTQLNAYSFRSKVIAISMELLQDSNFPFPAILERVFAMRHARGVGKALVSGSGVNQPTGLITGALASGAAVVVASGSSVNDGGAETGSTSIGTPDINAAYHKLDPAYRPGACWAMSDDTLKALEGLLDKSGRPLVFLGLGLNDNFGPCIYGLPVAICPSFPNLAATANSVVLYNPAYFIQRRVPSASYIRRYWQTPSLVLNGLVGFESWMRADSGLVAPNPSQVPAVIIQNHS